MKARTVLTLALAVALIGGILVALPQTDVSDAESVDLDEYLWTAAGYCENGWEAGVSLDLTDEEAYDAIKSIAGSLPENLTQQSPILGFIIGNPDSTADDLYSMILGEEGLTVDDASAASGQFDIYAVCEPTSNGFTITIKTSGSIDIDLRATYDGHTNPVLYSEIGYAADFDAAIILNLSDKLVPVSGNLMFTMTSTDTSERNYQTVYGDDGSDVAPSDVISDSGSSTVTVHGSADVSGMTVQDLDAVLNGGEEPVVDLFLVCSSSVDSIPSDPNGDSMSGYALRGPMMLPTGLLDAMGIDGGGFDDYVDGGTLIPSYGVVQPILQIWGLFIPQEDYNSISQTLRDMASAMMDSGSLDFGYTVGDSQYNTNLVSQIRSSLSDVDAPRTSPVMNTTENYYLSYHKAEREPGYSINFDSDSATTPTTINGYPVIASTGPSGYVFNFMVDGIGYSVQGSEATAILTFQNSGEITIPSIVTSDGTTYSVTGLLVDNARLDSLSVPSSVRYMQLLNSEVDELYLDAATGAYADNSRMDSIIYRGTGTYDIDLYWIDQGVYDLGSIIINGEVNNVYGSISDPAYRGIGSTGYTHVGIAYDLTVVNGQYTARATQLLPEETDISVYRTITVNGIDFTADWSNVFDLEGATTMSIHSIPDNLCIRSQTLETVEFDNTESIDIKTGTFIECYSLNEVTFNGPVDTIEPYGFISCISLGSVNFNSTVGIIGSYNFQALSYLTSLVFKGDVGTIEADAFGGCQNLETVTFNGNVDRMERNAFSECSSLTTITVGEDLGFLDGQRETNSLVSIDVTGRLGTIADGAFRNKTAYHIDANEVVTETFSVHAGRGVGTVGIDAFIGSSLGSFTVQGDVELISENAFDSSNLSEFKVSGTIHEVQNYAFDNTEVDITYLLTGNGDSRKTLNATSYAFVGMTSMYSDPCTGNILTAVIPEDESGIEFDIMLYLENGYIRADIVGILFSNVYNRDLTIPSKLTYTNITDKETESIEYHISGLGRFDGFSYGTNVSIGTLTIGNNITGIGEGMSRIMTNVTVDTVSMETSGYTVDTSTGLITILTHDGSTICSVLNRPNVQQEVYTVPDGVKVLDLTLFDKLSVKILNTNEVTTIRGSLDSMDGLERLNIGTDLTDFEVWNAPLTLQYITVDEGNVRYFAVDGILYERADGTENQASLVLVPANLTRENGEKVTHLTVPSTVNGCAIIGLNDGSFRGSTLTSVDVNANIDGLYGQIFYNTLMTNIYLPSGLLYVDSNSFDNSLPGLVVSSDDNAVFTHNGAIYHEYSEEGPDGETIQHKKFVTYIGDADILVIEDGTDEVGYGQVLMDDYPGYIIVPDSVTYANLEMINNSNEDRTYVLLPSGCYQDANFDSLGIVFRTYQASEDYGLEFTPVYSDGNLTSIDIKVDGAAYVTALINIGLNNGDQKILTSENNYTANFAIDELLSGNPVDGYLLDGMLTVSYSVREYTVTFDLNIEGRDDVHENVSHGATVDVPDVSDYDSAVFGGWYRDSSLEVPFDTDAPITSDITVYAKWIHTYTVTAGTGNAIFYINGEQIDGSKLLTEGEYHVYVEYEDGYTGDYTVMADGVKIDGNLTLDQNVTLTTNISPLPTEYKITLINDPTMGSLDDDIIIVPVGGSATLPTPKALDGYRFVGWTIGYMMVGDTITPSSDIEVTASYVMAQIDAEVSFSYSPSDGTPVGDAGTMVVEIGTAIELPGMETKHGLSFLGWTADGNLIDGDTYIVTGDVRLTALFHENPSTSGDRVVLDLHIDRSEGQFSGNTTINLTRGDTYQLPEIEGKRGFTMVAWSVDGVAYPGGTTITVDGNTTATAVFQKTTDNPITHRIQFSVNGDGNFEGPTQKIVIDGQTVEMPEVTAGSGYRFAGWYANGAAVQDGVFTVITDTVFVAQFDRIPTGGGGTGGGTPGDDSPDEEGSTTTDEDGNTIHEVTRPDGSSTTTTTRPDGSSTVVDVRPTEDGTQTVEEHFDSNGDLTGSTTTTTSETTTLTGNTVQSSTTTVADGNGNTVSEVTNVTSTSEDGSVKTEMTVQDGAARSQTTVTVQGDGTGTVTVEADKIQQALSQMDEVTSEQENVEKVITIQSDSYTPDKAEATLDADALTAVADSGASVSISGDVGTVTISPEVASTLSDSDSAVSVSVATGNRAAMNSAQKRVIGDSPVFELNATAGNESIHQLGGTVTVTVPYTLQPGDDPDSITVFYVDSDGNLEPKVTTYDPITHTITFVTDHFSYYMIGTTQQTPTDEGDDTLIYAGITIVVVIAIAAVAMVARKRL